MKIMTKIPIFITARGYNDQLFSINKESLKFSYMFIKEQNLFNQTYIISDNIDMINYAKEIGFQNTIHYECHTPKECMFLEYLATQKFSLDNNYYPDWIIILSNNQLFKNTQLLFDCITQISNQYDIVASYTEISDKSHFFIKNDEIINKENLTHILSSEQKREKMIDAAIYAIKTTFAHACMEYDDPSEYFWKNSKIKFFKNRSIYTDIYDMSDINKYKNIDIIIKNIKQMK